MFSSISRRNFLRTSAQLAAAATAVPLTLSAKPVWAQAPSDRIRMGCIGVGSMGLGDALSFNHLVDVVAVCDLDEEYGLARALRSDLGKRDANGNKIAPDTYKDYRRILERDDIDVVTIVTPDHWHVKIAVEALQAGKHVFCQKPLTLTLEENLIIRNACEKYGKTFQIGTWQRSQHDQFMLATIMVRKGMLGDIKHIVCHIDGSPASGELPVRTENIGLDWNTYLGQTPYTDFVSSRVGNDGNRFGQSRCHYEFRWWYEYSGGKFTDWGAHHIDSALWALNLQTKGTGPISVDGTHAEHPVPFKDGYPTVTNRYNTCTKFDIVMKFPNDLVINVVSDSPDGNGVLFEGTKGRIHVNRSRIKGKPFEEMDRSLITDDDYRELYNGKPYEWHTDNFIRCVREGGKPVSDVWSHVQAMHCCHLCGIAARLGREIQWDAVNEKIINDSQAASFFARERRKEFDIPKID